MANTALTIADLLSELQTWVPISDATMEKAKASNITKASNPTFKQYVNQWVNGAYDEAPERLVQRLIGLL